MIFKQQAKNQDFQDLKFLSEFVILFFFKNKNNDSLTPLCIASQNGYEDIALILLENISIDDLTDSTLHYACSFGEEKFKLVKKILEKLNKFDKKRLENLLSSLDVFGKLIDNNHLNIIDMVLKEYNECVVDLVDTNNNTLIHLAAKSGSTEILKLLIKHGCFSLKTNSNDENGLHIAAQNNRFKFIQDFLIYETIFVENLSNKVEISEENEPLIHESDSANEYIPSVNCLNKSGLTPLFLAINNGHLKSVECLINGTDHIDYTAQDLEGNTIYHKCAELNNFESLRFLVTRKEKKYLDPLYIKNKNFDTVVTTASNYGHLEIIRLVLSKIYDGFTSPETYLLSKNSNGQNCFHIACSKGFYNIVEYFIKDLKMKFFLESVDQNLNKPIHLASAGGYLSIVKILIQINIDINARNDKGYTALDISCRKGFFDISKVLITSFSGMKEFYNSQNNEYPLHTACQEGSYQVVDLLLSKGYPIDSKNNDNKNCLDIAIEYERREVIKVLLRNENWPKLIEISGVESVKFPTNIRNTSIFQVNSIIKAALFMRPKIKRESPQINELI